MENLQSGIFQVSLDISWRAAKLTASQNHNPCCLMKIPGKEWTLKVKIGPIQFNRSLDIWVPGKDLGKWDWWKFSPPPPRHLLKGWVFSGNTKETSVILQNNVLLKNKIKKVYINFRFKKWSCCLGYLHAYLWLTKKPNTVSTSQLPCLV